LIDELADKFCVNHGASKNSRKRLQKALFLVPRSRLDLLPYYGRFAGILDRVFADVAASLVIELEQQYHGLARFKKQLNIDSRLRDARFLGEIFLIIYKNSTNQQEIMSNQPKTKSMSFSNVNIREYEIIICDHPETSVGPSISLGWKYN